jgi:ribosome modulation factor
MTGHRPLHQYTPESLTRVRELRAEGLSWKQIAAELGGTGENWRSAVKREDANEGLPLPYRRGRATRLNKESKSVCPYHALTGDRSWWLAGWNDADLELEERKIGRTG